MEQGLKCTESVVGGTWKALAEHSRVGLPSCKGRWPPFSKHCLRQCFSNRAIFVWLDSLYVIFWSLLRAVNPYLQIRRWPEGSSSWSRGETGTAERKGQTLWNADWKVWAVRGECWLQVCKQYLELAGLQLFLMLNYTSDFNFHIEITFSRQWLAEEKWLF